MTRRTLQFDRLAEAVDESKRLRSCGYTRNGNWSLGQACHHIRLTVDASLDGYPWWMSMAAPIRPLLRWLVLPRLLRGDSPSGIKTAGIFVPPDHLHDADEIDKLSLSVARFTTHDGPFHPHPGFGRLEGNLLEQFHAMHAAHHFGFLADSD